MEKDNQLSRLDTTNFLEIISKIPNLTDEDRHELSKQVASDDREIRKSTFEKMSQSAIAHNDLVTIMGELSALNKEGMYVKSKQTIRTGSGTFEIESRGGDTKLIIPVLVIVGIVIVAVMIILFWHK